MSGALLAGFVLVVVAAVLVALAGWVAWRRVRVAVAPRARVQRAHLERGALAWHAARLRHGPHRQVVELRMTLHHNLAHTQRVLDTLPGEAAGPPVELFARLRASATNLDRRLRVVQGEPMTDYVIQQLPALTEQVAGMNADALALRRSATDLADAGSVWRRDEQDLRDQIHGLAHAARELRDPAASPTTPVPDTPRLDRPVPGVVAVARRHMALGPDAASRHRR
jgi:hypothetical protein